MDLSAGQAQGDGTTISVNEGMDLALEAASGTFHAAIIGSPFLPIAPFWWTRTQVESITTISPSKAVETASRMPAPHLGFTPANETAVAGRREAVALWYLYPW